MFCHIAVLHNKTAVIPNKANVKTKKQTMARVIGIWFHLLLQWKTFL